MKICCWCQTEKPFSDFHRRGTGYQSACKTCRKIQDKNRYASDPESHAAIRVKRKRELAIWAMELKRNKPCTDCNNSYHPVAMQWDHVSDNKKVNVSDMPRNGYSRDRVLEEIAKCELVCANCHSVRTYNRRLSNSLNIEKPGCSAAW